MNKKRGFFLFLFCSFKEERILGKGIKKNLLVFLALIMLFIVGGCTETDKAENKEETKQTTDEKKDNQDPKTEEKKVQDFVMKNTKIVKIFNISQRVNPKTPDLGPFFVIRGIDERGQKSEVWVKDLKIHEMNYSE